MVDPEGYVTECGSMSFFIVSGDRIMTRPLGDGDILPGVTRRAVIGLCETHGLRLVESRFTLDEALGADEAFISGASSYVLPVATIDGRSIGGGKPGPLAKRMREIYLEYARKSLV